MCQSLRRTGASTAAGHLGRARRAPATPARISVTPARSHRGDVVGHREGGGWKAHPVPGRQVGGNLCRRCR